jgi:dipeptidase D
MNRLLYLAAKQFDLRLSSVEGGSLRNAIPRESVAVVVVPKAMSAGFRTWLTDEAKTIQSENAETDPKMQISCEGVAGPVDQVLPRGVQAALFSAISGTLSGIHRMSPSIAGLVQTSNNLARVHVADGNINVLCLARSSVDSERDALTAELTSVLEQLGGPVVTSDQYPGWRPVPTSKIVTLMSGLYEEMFGEPAHVAACHAGLECGIIGDKFPGMEMISFGPNIYGAHSPDERVQISSVQKFYKYFAETLARL